MHFAHLPPPMEGNNDNGASQSTKSFNFQNPKGIPLHRRGEFHPLSADEICPSQKARFRFCFRLPFGKPPRRLRRHPSKEGNFLKFHPPKADEICPSQKAQFRVCFRLPFGRPPRRLRRHPSTGGEITALRSPQCGRARRSPLQCNSENHHVYPQKARFRFCFRLPFGKPPRRLCRRKTSF
jgi:hypothetical protein